MNSQEQLEKFLKDNKDTHYNDIEEIDYVIPTSSLKFDIEIGGGFHPSIIRTSGATEGGKTSMLLSVMKNFLEPKEYSGRKAKGIYVKAEGRLSKDMKDRSGVNFVETPAEWEAGTCWIFKTNVYETAIDLYRKLIEDNEENNIYYFIIDSLNGLIPKTDLEKSFEDANKVAAGALLGSDFLKRMALPTSAHGHMVGLVSQVRSNVQVNQYVKGDPKITNATGGNAYLHYSDWIFEFQERFKSDLITEGTGKDEKIVGHWAKIIFRKSTNEKTGTLIKYPIKHGRTGGNSVWVEYEIVDLLLGWSLAEKAGAWIKISDSLMNDLKENGFEDFPEKIQGVERLRKYLEENQDVTKFLYNKFKELCIN